MKPFLQFNKWHMNQRSMFDYSPNLSISILLCFHSKHEVIEDQTIKLVITTLNIINTIGIHVAINYTGIRHLFAYIYLYFHSGIKYLNMFCLLYLISNRAMSFTPPCSCVIFAQFTMCVPYSFQTAEIEKKHFWPIFQLYHQLPPKVLKIWI